MTRIYALVALFAMSCRNGPPEWEDRVTGLASWEHDCPIRGVRVLRDSGGRNRTVDLDVCGVRKRYRDVGDDMLVFVEIQYPVRPESDAGPR